jgi:hypothetical protein
MDDYDVTEESFTPFLRAVLSPQSETLAGSSQPVLSNACGSLLAVSQPLALAVAACGDRVYVVPLNPACTFGKSKCVPLPAPVRAVFIPDWSTALLVVLLDAQPVSTALRVYDLHVLAENGGLDEVAGFEMLAEGDSDNRIVSMQLVNLKLAMGTAGLFVCAAFDNGNAGMYRMDSAESSRSALRIHGAGDSLDGAASCVALRDSSATGSKGLAALCAVGTIRGRVLLYHVSSEGEKKCTGRLIELVSGWVPRYLYFLSNMDLLVAYVNDESEVRNIVLHVDATGRLVSTGVDSATYLGEVCYSSPNDDDKMRPRPVVVAVCIPSWPIAVLASSTSTDVELLGQGAWDGDSGDDADQGWRNWKLDEGHCIIMPGDDNDEDTFPVGVALNLTNKLPVPAASDAERPLKPMPRLLVLSSVGKLMEYVVADDRPNAVCKAVQAESGLVVTQPATESRAPASLVPASTVASFQAASRVRQRPTSAGSRSEVEAEDGGSGSEGSFEGSVTFDGAAFAQRQPIGNTACGNEAFDAENRDSHSDEYEGEVDTDEDDARSEGYGFGSTSGHEVVVAGAGDGIEGSNGMEARFGTGIRRNTRTFTNSPTKFANAAGDIEREMSTNLTSAIEIADNDDPASQLRSVHLEMDEEMNGVSRAYTKMLPVLEAARVQIAADLDTVSARILELRSSIGDCVGGHEQRHQVASECMKKTVSIGRDVEEAMLLFKTSGVKQLDRQRGLGADVLRVDQQLDVKEAEVRRALTSIEDKLERPVQSLRLASNASAGCGTVTSWRSSQVFGGSQSEDTCQQLFSSLSLQGARIKRVLAMLGAMESQFNDHRRMLRGRVGSDIGLSQARLEKLSLSGSQQAGHPSRSNTRTGVLSSGPKDGMSRFGTRASQVLSHPSGDRSSKTTPEGDRLTAETCRALRDIAMRNGRERIQVHPCNASSRLLGGNNSPLAKLPPLPEPTSAADSRLQGTSSRVAQAMPSKGGPGSRRGIGGVFTSTTLVRSGGRAFVGDSEAPSLRQSRSSTRPQPKASNFAANAVSGESASKRFGSSSSRGEFESSGNQYGPASMFPPKPPGEAGGNASRLSEASKTDSSSDRAKVTAPGNRARCPDASPFDDGLRQRKKSSPFSRHDSSLSFAGQGWQAGGISPLGDLGESLSKPALTAAADPPSFLGSQPALGSKLTGALGADSPSSLAPPSGLLVPSKSTKGAASLRTVEVLKSSAPSAFLPPDGSENDVVPTAVALPAGSEKGLMPATTLPPAGSEYDAAANVPLPPAFLGKPVPPAALPPSGSESDAFPVPTAGNFGLASEKAAVPNASLSPAGSETDAVPKASLPRTTPVKVVPTASLPLDGSETDTVRPASLPPDGSETDTVPAASLSGLGSGKYRAPTASMPPAGSESDAVPTALPPLPEAQMPGAVTASLPPSGSRIVSASTVHLSRCWPAQVSASIATTQQTQALSVLPPASGSDKDCAEQQVPEQIRKPQSSFSSPYSASFGQQATVGTKSSGTGFRDGAHENPSRESSFSDGVSAVETRTANSTSGDLSNSATATTSFNFGSVGFGNENKLSMSTTNAGTIATGGLFGASSSLGGFDSTKIAAFGAPTTAGQGSDASVTLNPSPFATSSTAGTIPSLAQSFASGFSSVSASPFGGVQAQTAPGSASPAGVFESPQQQSAGFGIGHSFGSLNPGAGSNPQFGATSGFGAYSQQSGVATASGGAFENATGGAAFGSASSGSGFTTQAGFPAVSQPTPTFGATSLLGFGASASILAGSAFGQPSSFGQASVTTNVPSLGAGNGGFGFGAGGAQQPGFGESPAGQLFGSAAPSTSSGFAALASQTASGFGSFGNSSPSRAGGGFTGGASGQTLTSFGASQGPVEPPAFGQSSPFGQQGSSTPEAAFTSPSFTQRRA